MVTWVWDVEPRLSIPQYMNRLKSMIAKRYRDIRNNYPRLPPKLMQSSYYDRYIRDDEELYEIRQYTLNNPRALRLKLDGHIQ